MDKEQVEWLQSLKEGDKVCYHSRYHGYMIVEIERITPTRQIRTSDKKIFKNGYCKLDSWDGLSLYPITDEIREKLFRRKLVYNLKHYDFEKMTTEQLKRSMLLVSESEGLKDTESTEQPKP